MSLKSKILTRKGLGVISGVIVLTILILLLILERLMASPHVYFPEWHPNGEYIVFYQWEVDKVRDDTITKMYRIDRNGDNLQRIGPAEPGYPSLPTYSPDGKYLLFSNLTNIYKLDIENGSSEKLTDADDVRFFGPQFSPDGQTIVYDNMSPKGNIHLMKSDGSEQHKLEVNGSRPAFSPDGKSIVYHAITAENEQIMLMKSNGEFVKQLTTGPSDSFDPSYSPDGKHVVFGKTLKKGWNEVFEINIETGEERKLTSLDQEIWGVDYSPDGLSLIFAAGPNLYLMNRTDGIVKNIYQSR